MPSFRLPSAPSLRYRRTPRGNGTPAPPSQPLSTFAHASPVNSTSTLLPNAPRAWPSPYVLLRGGLLVGPKLILRAPGAVLRAPGRAIGRSQRLFSSGRLRRNQQPQSSPSHGAPKGSQQASGAKSSAEETAAGSQGSFTGACTGPLWRVLAAEH